jgi:endonuclease YncB( thermonuclease family)
MSLFSYRGVCSRVVDGDTVELDVIDLGFGVMQFGIPEAPLRFRLAGVNAYETRLGRGTTPEEKVVGLEAKEWLRELIEGQKVRVRTVRGGSKGSFGRWLAYLYVDGDEHEALLPGNSLNRELLDKGYAVVSEYDDGEAFIALGYSRE